MPKHPSEKALICIAVGNSSAVWAAEEFFFFFLRFTVWPKQSSVWSGYDEMNDLWWSPHPTWNKREREILKARLRETLARLRGLPVSAELIYDSIWAWAELKYSLRSTDFLAFCLRRRLRACELASLLKSVHTQTHTHTLGPLAGIYPPEWRQGVLETAFCCLAALISDLALNLGSESGRFEDIK